MFFQTSCRSAHSHGAALGILWQQFPWLCGMERKSQLGVQAFVCLLVSGIDHKPACQKGCQLTCSATPFEA